MKNYQRGFEIHGIDFHQITGNNGEADCPFCEGERKFYANIETGGWDCKLGCGQGWFDKFLFKTQEIYKKNLTSKDLKILARDRELPVEAFKGLGLGIEGKTYMLPVYRVGSGIQDIRRYRVEHWGDKARIRGTAGCDLGIFRFPQLLSRKKEVVYLCEGEWDTIALTWLLKVTGKEGVVVGCPGAKVFKKEWAKHFSGRDVRVCYDNDKAGREGEVMVAEKLQGVVSSIKFLHWPDRKKEGYDVRDWVKSLAVKKGKPKKCYKFLHSFFKDSCRIVVGSEAGVKTEKKRLLPISREELLEGYQKWLHLKSLNPLVVLYGTLIANKLADDPIWLFLVAPPSGSKSELLMSLKSSEYTYALTTLTPQTLISGAFNKQGQDASLLPLIDKKVLIIKDFTTILSMNEKDKESIFAVLRDAYDGSIQKAFGSGTFREYNVKFGILAGVTNVIEMVNKMHASLGERFLKFRISGWEKTGEKEKIIRAMQNSSNKDLMREELRKNAERYIQNIVIPEKLPEASGEVLEKIICLAQFTARLRGVVPRNKFTGEVNHMPMSEVGVRLALQFQKLARGIAIFLEKDSIDLEVYRLIRRVALDTVPDIVEKVIRKMWLMGSDFQDLNKIAHDSKLPRDTVRKVLDDFNLLKISEKKQADGFKTEWRLSEYVRELIVGGGIHKETNYRN